MYKILYIFLLACFVILSGCDSSRETQEDQSPKIDSSNMVKVQDFVLTGDSLILDYKVSNPFTEDIRVCQDINVYGNQHVATMIDDETIWIKLRYNIERDNALRNPPAIGKYLRMPPGESYSGKIC